MGVGLARVGLLGVAGFGNGYLETPKGNLGPVRWIAETPRDLLRSRPEPAATAVEEKFEHCTGGRIREK